MVIRLNKSLPVENPDYNFSLYLKSQLERSIYEKLEQKNRPLLKYTSDPIHLNYTIYPTLFGQSLVVYLEKDIYYIAFFDDIETAHEHVKTIFTNTKLSSEEPKEDLYNDIFVNSSSKLNLYIKGTPFQISVWETLYKIKSGTLVSYEDIAILINKPTALRAVGSAIGRNNISLLIPCHRVINKNGSLNNYAWGLNCKKALILNENSNL